MYQMPIRMILQFLKNTDAPDIAFFPPDIF